MLQKIYQISPFLLENIKQIAVLVAKLNDRRFSKPILIDLANNAQALSVHSSTSIEGNPLPLTEVKKIIKTRPSNLRDTQREVLNYNEALIFLNEQLKLEKQLSLDLILNIHRLVTYQLLEKYETGKLRQKPVVVNNPKTKKIVYLPPDHDQVKPLLTELITFINANQTQIDPLILAGIFHKQFVIIHPFMDGNGRTARLITKFLLAQMGLNTFNLFSFENYYNQNVSKYFQIVGEFGDYNDLIEKFNFTNWLEYFTAGIIDELLRVGKILEKNNHQPNNQLEKHHRKILKYLENNPFITDRDYSKLTSRAKATRVLDFQRLIDLELIERISQGRSTHYIILQHHP